MYGLLQISSGPGGEDVEREGKQEGKKTQMGNEPVHLSGENAFQSSRQHPSPQKKKKKKGQTHKSINQACFYHILSHKLLATFMFLVRSHF